MDCDHNYKSNMYFLFAGFTLQLSVNSLFPEALSLRENLHNFQGRGEERLMGLGKTLVTANLKTKHTQNAKLGAERELRYKFWSAVGLQAFTAAAPWHQWEPQIRCFSLWSTSWTPNMHLAHGYYTFNYLQTRETKGSPWSPQLCFSPSFGTTVGRITQLLSKPGCEDICWPPGHTVPTVKY